MTATIDEVAKTLGEFEALAQKTGEWDGADPVEFSIDGTSWSTVWTAVGDWKYPPFARATVHRKGVAAPTVIVVAWDESLPALDEWRELWERKPMKLFGSFALRSAIRHAFRDAVGDLTGPDEVDPNGPTVGGQSDAAIERDWDAEIAGAETARALEELWGLARAARARTGAREKAYKARLAVLTSAEWEPVELAEVAGIPVEAATQAIADLAAAPKPGPARPGRAPQDYKPGNRAARRAAAKGRRK